MLKLSEWSPKGSMFAEQEVECLVGPV